jgi:hypothetical protein
MADLGICFEAIPHLEEVTSKKAFVYGLGVDSDSLPYSLEMRGCIQADFEAGIESAQDGVAKGRRRPFTFSSCDVYHVEIVEIRELSSSQVSSAR